MALKFTLSMIFGKWASSLHQLRLFAGLQWHRARRLGHRSGRPGRAKSCFVHCSEDNPFRKLALVHSVVHRASVKLGAWFDRQPRTYAVSIRSSVGPRAGQRGPPCQKMTDDVHNPAVNWYGFHNRDGMVRRRMRFARM